MKRDILHIDMNNFFASVECLLDPSLRGKPVAVCGSVEDRHGIVLAKNYEAKAYGIKTAETVPSALGKCRTLVIVPPHYKKYVEFSKKARDIYSRYTDLIEPFGIDECWLDISGTRRLFGTPENVAFEIKEAVKNELGLTVSVGVSFNKIFAKLGSDLKKPDAVTVISEENFKRQIWGLGAGELMGVGPKTSAALARYGIHTIGALAGCDPRWIEHIMGKTGLLIRAWANGLDRSPVTPSDRASDAKSVGHGETPRADLTTNTQIKAFISELSQDIGQRLRLEKKRAKTVMISVRSKELFIKQWQCALPVATQSPTIITQTAFELFTRRYDWQQPVRSMTVTALDLEDEDLPYQLMFTDSKAAAYEKTEAADAAVYKIRGKFGSGMIKTGFYTPR